MNKERIAGKEHPSLRTSPTRAMLSSRCRQQEGTGASELSPPEWHCLWPEMGSRKRGHTDLLENGLGRPSEKSPRRSDAKRGAAYPRSCPEHRSLLESLESRRRKRLPILPLLLERRDELEKTVGSTELRRADVLLLIQALGEAAAEIPEGGQEEEAGSEELLLAIFQPVLRSSFLLRHLLRFVAGIGEATAAAVEVEVDAVETILRKLILVDPEAVRPLVHVPADLLHARLQRLWSQGLSLPWPTQWRLCDLRKTVNAQFPPAAPLFLEEATFSKSRPRDISQLPIVPTPEELLGGPDPWLQPNIVQGPHTSTRAYLDAHYRLLREDVLRPLRDGLAACLIAPALRRKLPGALKSFRRLRLLGPDCQWEGVAYKATLRLGLPPRRLAKGSLVCLFATDCEQIFPATVVKGDARGFLWLRFLASHRELSRHLYRHTFCMVESPAFFELYRHVLRGLQETKPAYLPFQRYLVKCRRHIRPPQYLQPHTAHLDMQPLLGNSSVPQTWDGLDEDMGLVQEEGTELDHLSTSEGHDCPAEDDSEATGSRESPAEVGECAEDEVGHPAAEAGRQEEEEKVTKGDSTWDALKEFISIVKEGSSKTEQQSGTKSRPPAQHSGVTPSLTGSPSEGSKYVVNPFRQDLRTVPWLKHFDRSQLKALQKALTREFAIIEGSPGTGKTFVKLKLVQLLLHNRGLWQNSESLGQDSPILVVCHTDHELDLFLEGLLESNCCSIVRIGGVCKSQKLQKFTLENIRKKRLQTKLTPLQRRRFKEIKEKIEVTKADIAYCSKVLEMLQLGILRDDELAPEIKADAKELRLPSIPLSDSKRGVILDWLKIPFHLWPPMDMDWNPALQDAGREQAQGRASPIHHYLTGPVPEAATSANFVFAASDEEEGEWEQPLCSAEQWASEKFAYIVNANTRDQQELAIQRHLTDQSIMSAEEVQKIESVWDLSLDHRWRLYRRWRTAYQDKLNASMNDNLELYDSIAQDLSVLDLEETVMLLSEAAVFGMTALGTARHRTLLQHIKPRIVIFDEVSKVLEAQVVTTLTPACQHLIMIGDRQLKPKVVDYENATKMGLNVSLFERMIGNQIPSVQLVEQQMQTEISQVPTSL
ncbi:NFX1-type zinc finger-containing protein 1-like isoform X2 [Hypanus sabinus]|uniref:NFX1-type zinc finger-containing protein 1-like isoform X2 n=1 Tax=Hypanus sabinus TaxID=79690 RepID=UPI0028C41E72|nr:NFX1-type zinc finger-containing protein 1-like isoform X2 [Hypanus sabinus]XP_059827595.1 NFX1-type zinc finger-containing protein 1-like isoform X2 [Hypanus sabinus]